MFGKNNVTLPQLISAIAVSSQSVHLTRFYADSFLVQYRQLYHQLVLLLQPDAHPRMFCFRLQQ